jgi:hypothetical protein
MTERIIVPESAVFYVRAVLNEGLASKEYEIHEAEQRLHAMESDEDLDMAHMMYLDALIARHKDQLLRARAELDKLPEAIRPDKLDAVQD